MAGGSQVAPGQAIMSVAGRAFLFRRCPGTDSRARFAPSVRHLIGLNCKTLLGFMGVLLVIRGALPCIGPGLC
jgi:hypothetical protein